MPRHAVETCPDDLALLQERLDALAETGARIVSVVWQARRAIEEDQTSALDGRGSFVIIAELQGDSILRERGTGATAGPEAFGAGRA